MKHQNNQFYIVVLLIIFALQSIVLADQSDQEQIKTQLETLKREKQKVDGSITELSSKSIELQKFEKELMSNYKYLSEQRLRLKGIQLWNGFTAFVSVAFNCLQKVNPGTSIITNIAGFVQDRASDTLSNAPLEAQIKHLSAEMTALSPALRRLDRALTLTPNEVADLLVSRGMVGDIEAISVRWDGNIRLPATPEEIAKSPAVITGKTTFILERMDDAMKSLYSTRKATGKSISEIALYLSNAKIKSLELGVAIAKLEGKVEYEKILEDISKETLADVKPEITIPVLSDDSNIQPQSHASAFAEIQSAWQSLKANAIDGKTYVKIKNQRQTASLLYGDQKTAPSRKIYKKINDYVWGAQFKKDLDSISDRYVRIQFSKQKWAEWQSANDIGGKVSEEQRKERERDFFKPLKQLHEEELSEKNRFAEFSSKVDTLQKTPVTRTLLFNDLSVQTLTEPLSAMITSTNLAGAAWSETMYPRLFHSFYYAENGVTLPSVPLARVAIVKAKSLLDGASVTSSQMQAIITQAEEMATEVKPNLNLWTYLNSASDLGGGSFRIPDEWLSPINVSSQVFNAEVSIHEKIAEAEYESLKAKATEVIQRAEAISMQNKQVEQAKSVAVNWTKAKAVDADNGLDAQGTTTKAFLEKNNLTQEEIEKIKKTITELKTPKDIENYLLKELVREKEQSQKIPKKEQLASIQNEYLKMKETINKNREVYPSLVEEYTKSYSKLEENLYALESQYPLVTESFSIEDIMAKAGQTLPMSDWALPSPDDLSPLNPTDDAVVNDFIEVATQYNDLVAPYLEKTQRSYTTAKDKMIVLARKPLTTAILQPDISPEEFEKRLSVLVTEAQSVYVPFAFLDTAEKKTDIGIQYQNLLNDVNKSKEQYLMFWLHDTYQIIEEISDNLQSNMALSQEKREVYQQELNALIAPNSFVDKQKENIEIKNLITIIDNLLKKLTPSSSNIIDEEQMVRDFYQSFKEAYESKRISQISSLISSDWSSSADGIGIDELEEYLGNSFEVFDDITYNMSNLSIQKETENVYSTTYDLEIIGEIYDNEIEHIEKSTVSEKLNIIADKVVIFKTTSGQFWSIK
jgi:hypothetical protein